ncbi:MAG: proprotein convertase P-domain-containing protein [Sumerlaeia bacterium]
MLEGTEGTKPLKLAYRWRNTTPDGDPLAAADGEWSLYVFDIPSSLPDFPTTAGAYLLADPEFTQLEKYQAYWLYLELPVDEESVDFVTTGTLGPGAVHFDRGWNLLGLPLGDSLAVSGTRTQIDFESVLRGARDRIAEVYYVDSNNGTGFYPAEPIEGAIPAISTFFSGSFVSGSGNWFYATEDFDLTPKLRTVFPPDSDFPPENLNGAPVADDVDRNRYHNVTGIIEDGEDVRDIVFRFQALEALVEEVLPVTISNRGTRSELENADPEDDGQGVLAYQVTWHPLRPGYTTPHDPLTTPAASAYIPVDDFSEFPEDSPFRTWLRALLPTETRVLLPDGRVDPVVVSRAQPLSENPVTGFSSTDINGLTLVADRAGLPVNTSTADVDSQGAPKPINNLLAHGELHIHSNAAPVRRVRVRAEVPPLAGTFEGKAYITRINGIPADPAFSMDMSLSLFEDAEQRLRGVIDSERVLLYPKDVPITGTKLTSDGNRYVLTGSFFLNPGDVNRHPYDRYNPSLSDDGTGDVDWDLDGKYDRLNPLPYLIERSMIFYGYRESDRLLSGEFSETLAGLTAEPMNLEGVFEVLRVSYEARKRGELSWTNPRIIAMDATGLSPFEEIRSTVKVDRPVRIDDLTVELAIDHPRVGDLEVSLQAPDLNEYVIFAVDDFTSGGVNFDGRTANLYEAFSSAPTAPPGSLQYRKNRTRRAPDLGKLKGVVAGSATLYGRASINGEETPNVPAALDSSQTACFSLFSESGGFLCDPADPGSEPPAALAIANNSRTVRVSSWYFRSGASEDEVTDLVCSTDGFAARYLSTGDPLEAGSVIGVVLRADPNPIDPNPNDGDTATTTSWLLDIDTYQAGLSYPPQLLEFIEARTLPTCQDNLAFPNFSAAPQVEERAGSLILSARDRSGATFRGGALCVVYFRVLPVDEPERQTWLRTPLTLPADSVTTAAVSLGGGGKLTDVNLNGLNITHPSMGDLTLELEAPGGQRIVLMDREGGDGGNAVNLTFDDESAESILGTAAPFTGRFQPQEPLACLIGAGNATVCGFAQVETDGEGQWILRITNHNQTRSGKLNSWGLEANRRLSPNYAVNLTAPPTLWTLIVRDSVQGPEDAVPNPRLVRWGLRVSTSGGQIKGTVVNESGSPVRDARVSLVGREVIPERVTASDGSFSFDAEFGIYTLTVSHPDYQQASVTRRFFENDSADSQVLDVGEVTLLRRQGFEEAGRYALTVQPYEAWVLAEDTAETAYDESTTEVRIEFKVPSGADLGVHTMTVYAFDGATTSPVSLTVTSLDGSSSQTATTIAGGMREIYAGTAKFGAGVYAFTIQTNQPTFPGLATSEVAAPLPLTVHSTQGQGSKNWWINRYAFYTGTSDPIGDKNPANTPNDPAQWNYFLRDTAGFDLDRPSVAVAGNTVSPYPAAAYSTQIDPQDSESFAYEDDLDVFPNPSPDGSPNPDGRYDPYPRNPDGGQLRWRAFLSFNSQIVGSSFGTLQERRPAGQEAAPQVGTIFFSGAMPLFAIQEREDSTP